MPACGHDSLRFCNQPVSGINLSGFLPEISPRKNQATINQIILQYEKKYQFSGFVNDGDRHICIKRDTIFKFKQSIIYGPWKKSRSLLFSFYPPLYDMLQGGKSFQGGN
jgi:hypothetical protein